MPDLQPLRRLITGRTLDAELASLLWLLLEARVPLVVVGPGSADRDRLLDGLAGFLPAGARTVEIAPDDDFDWLPEAIDLGWRRERGSVSADGRRASSSDCILVAHGLADPAGIAGTRARIVVRALSLGYGLLATMAGDGLDDVLDALHDPVVGTDPDERSRLGVVLVLADDTGTPRVGAAHYLRPVALDTHGHVQRQPPAVLATWNGGADRWDHFAWGVMPDLAGRLGVRPIELEREQARRAGILGEAAATG
ncbi:MAG TPA: hypothetical protein VES19_16565 [Candidatus Limnocylindrales bacterium]|nr:hypothetical protein [Candidatus Limnocylindrales bacterium]